MSTSRREYLNGLLDEFLATRGTSADGGWPTLAPDDLSRLRDVIDALLVAKFDTDADGDSVIDYTLCDRNHGRLFAIVEPQFSDDVERTPAALAANLLRLSMLCDRKSLSLRDRADNSIRDIVREEEKHTAAMARINAVYAMMQNNAALADVRVAMAELQNDAAFRNTVSAEYAMLSRAVAGRYSKDFAEDIKAIRRLLDDPDPVRLMVAKERILQLQKDAGTDVSKELVYAYNEAQHPARKAARKAKLPVTDDIEAIHPFFD